MEVLGLILGRRNADMAYKADCEIRRYQQALNNFRARHGYEPDPAMNMVSLIENYGGSWRNTPIPQVKRKPPNP